MKNILLLSFALTFGLSLGGRGAESPNEAAATIPDLVWRVDRIKRIDAGHVIVVIQAVAKDAAKASVDLRAPALKRPANATEEDIMSGKYEARGLSLLPASLTDEKTGQKYEAIDPPAGFPYLGSSLVRTSLEPGSSIQMAVCFNAPAPLPPDESGKRPEQKVTMALSYAALPIKGLVLPPDFTALTNKKP